MTTIDYILELDDELTFFNDEFSHLRHHGFREYKDCKKNPILHSLKEWK